MPTVIIPPTDVSPNTGTGSEVLSNAPTLVNPIITGTIDVSGNITAADLILGSSGPSVKSTLSARAPRQGLVFDGTFNSSISTAVPAFGTNDFSVAAIVNTDLSVNLAGIIGSNTTGGFGLFLYNSGVVNVQHIGIATIGSSTGAISANKSTLVVYTRSGTTGTFYINGVVAGTITDGSGGTPTNYSQTTNLLGQVGGLNIIKGTVAPLIYNRALSASEVVSLFEAGVPSGADYNAQGNLTFSGIGGTYTGTANATSGNVTAGAGHAYINYEFSRYFEVGQLVRVSLNVTAVSGAGATVYIPYNNYVTPLAINSTGLKTQIVTVGLRAYTGTIDVNPGGSITYDSLTVTPLGLLLAPDAGQAGGGLTWYDTSGNAANITLPASGVSWNVPSSRVLGGNWTTSGNHFFGTTTDTGGRLVVDKASQVASSSTASGGIVVSNLSGGNAVLEFGANATYLGYIQTRNYTTGSYYQLNLNPVAGNVLIGGTTDVGDKLQVGGAISASPSGAGYLVFTRHGSQNTGLYYNGAQGLVLYTNTTTALTLDSSQNATFAGQVNSGTSSSSGYNNNRNVQLEAASGRVIVNHENGVASGSIYAGFGYNGSGIGSITQDGTSGVLYNTTSDKRLKENVRDVTNSGVLIDALKPRVFDWKNNGDKDRFGFLAQEVYAVFPQAVKKGDDGKEVTDAWAMDAAKLIPVLVAEIKALRVRIAAVETR